MHRFRDVAGHQRVCVQCGLDLSVVFTKPGDIRSANVFVRPLGETGIEIVELGDCPNYEGPIGSVCELRHRYGISVNHTRNWRIQWCEGYVPWRYAANQCFKPAYSFDDRKCEKALFFERIFSAATARRDLLQYMLSAGADPNGLIAESFDFADAQGQDSPHKAKRQAASRVRISLKLAADAVPTWNDFEAYARR